MRLYKTTGYRVHDSEEDANLHYRDHTVVLWSGTQAASASDRRWLNSQGFKRDHIMTTEVEVPTIKKELVKFLNEGGLNG